MDKNAIKKYAVWARNELIARVSQRAQRYGISKDQIVDANADSVNGIILTDIEKKQRQALIQKIREKGFEQVVEEVAYTWFNRFSALRFMEVNGYLPSHVRVFTDQNNAFKPEIMAEAIHLDLDGLEMEKVYALKEANNDDELFKYLIITQCNDLSKILPGMFQKIADYTELLFPDNLLREGSVIEQMITLIPEEDWKDQVQIIGWLYQYYNTEPNELVYDGTLSKSRISKDLIPAATTIYTPDWAIRYMVDNSLGKIWIEGHPNDELKSQWKYYLDEADQESDVQRQLIEIRKEYSALKPEDIKCIDPCCGSGHILAYMFDVLVQIYEAYGISARDAAVSIVRNNIYGLDIDDRAAQLANFSVMMKARQYDRRFFSRGIQSNVYSIKESNNIDSNVIDYFCDGKANIQKDIKTIISEYIDAKEYGSILNIERNDFNGLYARVEEIKNDINIYKDLVISTLLPLIKLADIMSQKYDIIVTNPPYLGFNRFNPRLAKYVTDHYLDVKSDMSSVMLKRALSGMSRKNGFVSFITTSSWMFLSSFETFREALINNYSFDTIVDYGTELFDGKVGHNQITSCVIRNSKLNKRITSIRLVDYCYARRDEKEPQFFNLQNRSYTSQSSFSIIPGKPISYWATERQAQCFNRGKRVDSFAFPKQGMATADNNRFLRLWFEVNINNCYFDCKTHEESLNSSLKWYPYNKGGGYRKWYGNNEYLVNWQHDGSELKAFKGSVIRSPQFYFQECGSWCKVTSADFSMRYIPKGFLFDVAGCSLFEKNGRIKYLIGFMNSVCNKKFLSLISPTLNFEVGHVSSLPILFDEEENTVETIVDDCISIAKKEWDSFEVSWDFIECPIVSNVNDHEDMTIEESFGLWSQERQAAFEKLRKNEVRLNNIFLKMYKLDSELDSSVDDKDITLRKADLGRDIRGLISYAVGCMFGRYSLDEKGLVFAGGNFDKTRYRKYEVDSDNIIPICDDEYFDDDIVARFINFIRFVFGEKNLESNLTFIAMALGGKGTSRDVIRKYFMDEFYSDHLKMYQKRPIYWQFDSGKKNGFKCLVYMHRYQPDLIARIRTDYVHEQQSRYRTAIEDAEQRIKNSSTSDRVKLNKQISKLRAQADELHLFEEKIHHLADQYISLNMDDGVKANYAIFNEVLTKIK